MSNETEFIPITPPFKYSIGPIIISFLLIALVVGIGLYLYTKGHHIEVNRKVKEQNITIHNKSSIKYNLKINGRTIVLSPNSSDVVPIKLYENVTISGYDSDGKISSYNYRLSGDKITELYITNSGIQTNLDGNKNVILINESNFPILFVEHVNDKNISISDTVYPRSNIHKEFLGKNITIGVHTLTDRENNISRLTIRGNVTKIIFDGDSLKAY